MRLQFTNSLLHTYFYLCNNLGFDYELFPRRCGFQLAAFAIQEREHTDLRGKTVGQAIDRRHRNKNGRIARKYGNTYIRTLRIRYGVGFAHGEHAERKLIDVLHHLDNQSLGRLVEELSGPQTRRSENSPLASPPPGE
jgi:hypothetical protein